MAVVWDLNNSYLSGAAGSQAMYYLKEAMKAAGWKVNGSSDGTSHEASVAKPIGAGTTDYINTSLEFLVNGAWIVLEGPGGRQFLFGHKGGTGDTTYCVAYSRSDGFVGGAVVTYPTAADSGTVAGTLPATLATIFLSGNSYVHIMVSDTTDAFYCLQVIQGTGLVGGGLFCDLLTNTVAGDVDPAVVGYLYGSGSDGFSNSNLYGLVGSKGFYKNGAAYDFQLVTVMTYRVAGNDAIPYTTSGLGLNPHDLHTDELPAIWARSSAYSAPYGYKGISSLFRAVGSNIAAGDTLDSDGALSRVVYGGARTSLPWDGATVPLI